MSIIDQVSFNLFLTSSIPFEGSVKDNSYQMIDLHIVIYKINIIYILS